MTTTILMTIANLTVFPCVCQMETLGIKGLNVIKTWEVCVKWHVLNPLIRGQFPHFKQIKKLNTII